MDTNAVDETGVRGRVEPPVGRAAALRPAGEHDLTRPEAYPGSERRFRLYWDPKRRVLLRTR